MENNMQTIHRVVQDEIAALNQVSKEIENDSDSYEKVFNLLFNCKNYVIFMGVGKTGHIGSKLAATFASLGIPSFFIDATESMHGDLGMIKNDDIVILISNSGETKETLAPIQYIKKLGAKTIAMTGNKNSTLAQECDANILVHVEKEADQYNLALTNSSTAALVVGDALACALSEAKGFTKRNFASFHPGGALGRQLLAKDNVGGQNV